MTREERNRQISEIREPVPTWVNQDMPWDGPAYLSDGGAWYSQREFKDNANPDWDGPVLVPKPSPIEWHQDLNWPTLLREMPKARLVHFTDSGSSWEVNTDFCDPNAVVLEDIDLADAVTEAWLKWKARDGEVR